MKRYLLTLLLAVPFAWAMALEPAKADSSAPPAAKPKEAPPAAAAPATPVAEKAAVSDSAKPIPAKPVVAVNDTAKKAAEAKPAAAVIDTATKAAKPNPVAAVADTAKEATEPKPVAAANDTVKKAGEAKLAETRIFLAVVDFVPVKVSAEMAMALSDSARKAFTDLGLYSVIGREQMLGNLATLKRKIPQGCSEARCILTIGKLLGMSKIIGGEISHDGKLFALKMTMTDVVTGQIEARVWLASECAESDAAQLITAGILKLHHQAPPKLSIAVKDYRGPEFSKHPLWAVTAGATIAAGLAYGLIDGGLTGRDNNSYEAPNYTGSDEPVSGIPAAFANLGYGARPHGMGYAYTAISDDADGLYWNPAGLARLKKDEVSGSYLGTMVDVGYYNAQYVSRFSRTGGFGAGILHNGDDVYGETEIISSCAKLFDEIHPSLRPVAVGVNMKIRTASTGTVSDSSASTGNSFGISFDAGLQIELADHIEMGLVARDVFSKLQKWNNTYSDTSYYEGTPATLVLGGAFYVDPTLILAIDGHIPVYQDQIYKIGLGLEKTIFNVLALRAGVFQNLEFNEDRRITAGAGLDLRNFGLDVSYEFGQDEIMGGAKRISTSWKF